ncbi:MAG: redoxin domain-containing protein [Ignavibacteriales bacterium]|nr:redoxin domain-containing protein [Ignavibacteriales bacterium]
MELEPKHIHAPELYGNFWLNSEPISLRDYSGEVVLIDFWDYTCVNCIRTLPYIQEWQKKYKTFGLTVVGVHTPEFEFGASQERVQKALENFKITYPVMLDNKAIIWNAYSVRYWPTRCLVDRDGYIRFVQHGEGGYVEFERAIQQLLSEAGSHGELPALTVPFREEDRTGAVCFRPTSELYLGYLRGALGNPEGYNPESTLEYTDPGIYLPERFYATGKWMNERQCLRFDGNEGENGGILFPYQAREVNAVMGSRDGSVCEVGVQQNSQPLRKEIAGEDIILWSKQQSSLFVDVPRMYTIVRNKEFGSHLLKLITANPKLEVYSFSFTTSVIPELISTN